MIHFVSLSIKVFPLNLDVLLVHPAVPVMAEVAATR